MGNARENPVVRQKPGTRISFGDGLLVGEVVDIVDEGNRLIHFEVRRYL